MTRYPMNYGSISRKSSSGSSRASRLSVFLCLIFFLAYFSFLLFFRNTDSVAIFQYMGVLLILSILVSGISAFFSEAARITLALQLIFSAVCVVNYFSFQTEMKKNLTEAQTLLESRKKEYALYQQEYLSDTTQAQPTEEDKVVATKCKMTPLLLTRQNWRSYGMALAEILPLDEIYSHERAINYLNEGTPQEEGKSAGWLGYTKRGTGRYFGLFYYATPFSMVLINKGTILKRPDLTHMPQFPSLNCPLFSPRLIIKDITEQPAEGRTLSFLLELEPTERHSGIAESIGSITWKLIPAKPKTSAKRKLEFR